MTTITHKGRSLRVFGEVTNEYHPYGSTTACERLLTYMRVEDADTGEDLTDEFGDDQEVINAAWDDAEDKS